MAAHTCHLEIACFSPFSALLAAKHGVHRIEFCAGPPSSGGLTPSAEDLTNLIAALSVPGGERPAVHVMIRPRSNDFTSFYTDVQIDTMAKSIIKLKEAGADGFVFGVLCRSTDDCVRVDVRRTRTLVEAAAPLPCIFHRAFDLCGARDPDKEGEWSLTKAMKEVHEAGCKGVLTSGGPDDVNAAGNVERLRKIVLSAREELEGKADVIIGGGIRSSNLSNIMDKVGNGGGWYHSSARSEQSGDDIDVEELGNMVTILKDRKRRVL